MSEYVKDADGWIRKKQQVKVPTTVDSDSDTAGVDGDVPAVARKRTYGPSASNPGGEDTTPMIAIAKSKNRKRRKRLVVESETDDSSDEDIQVAKPNDAVSTPKEQVTIDLCSPTPTTKSSSLVPVKTSRMRLAQATSSRIALEEESADDLESDSDAENESDDGIDHVELLFTRCESLATRIREKAATQGIMNGDDDQVRTVSLVNDGSNSTLVTAEQVAEMFSGGLKLKDYQLVGLNWLHLLYSEEINSILADEMGLGKTIQTIALLGLLNHRYGIKGPHLVVAPGSTLENWRREIEKWLPNARICFYHGSQAHRQELYRTMSGKGKFDIMLTTYTYFERQNSSVDRSFFNRFKFEYTIYDEAHAIKSMGSARYKRLVKLRSNRRLLLSGTPIQNNLLELLALMSFCMPQVFDSQNDQLVEMFKDHASADTARIRRALGPFILRRLKTDVLSQLSPKIEDVKLLKLDGVQAELYHEIIRNYKTAIASKQKCDEDESSVVKAVTNSNVQKVKNIFTQLRKAANHPLLVRNLFGKVDPVTGVDRRMDKVIELFYSTSAFGNAATPAMIEKEVKSYSDWELNNIVLGGGPRLAHLQLSEEQLWTSAKCRVLKELLPSLIKDGHRMLLFSQWTTILDIIECLLNSLEISFVRFDGSTAMADRQALVDKYQNDDSIKVFLLSTRSGGMGINLTSADVVITHDLDFNPTVDRQSEDRAHRIGQTKPVTIIKLVAADTVDQGILELQNRKKQLDAKVLVVEGATDVPGGSKIPDDTTSMQEILLRALQNSN